MTPLDVIRWASREGIDLNTRGGRLFVRGPVLIPPDLAAAIKADKTAVIACLEEHATNRARLNDLAESCLPLVPADLTAAERSEAETLAADLTAAGTLGHFVCDLCTGWPNLGPRDQLAAVVAWQVAASQSITLEDAV